MTTGCIIDHILEIASWRNVNSWNCECGLICYLRNLKLYNLALTRPIDVPPHIQDAHPKSEGGVSEVRFKKTRLLHLGNVKKLPHPQFFTKRAWKFINSMDLKRFETVLNKIWKFRIEKSQISNTRCLSKIRWQKGQL